MKKQGIMFIKKLRYLCLIGVIVLGLITIVATSADDESTTTDGDGTTSNIIFSAAKDTGPVFTATTSASDTVRGIAATWNWGFPMFELFNLLRDYVHSRDEGLIGLDNIYKVLHQASSFYSDAENLVESITPQVIDSPFDLGNMVTYDQAVNDTTMKHGYAIRVDGNTEYALITWSSDLANAGDSYGVMQGSYNDSTGALEIDMAVYFDYDSIEDFSIRMELVGNAQTHEFTTRFGKSNAGGFLISVVGKGVSQGASSFFLFKVRAPNITDKYFCFDANADEDTLRAEDDAGSDTVANDCSSYATVVDILTAFTSSDIPTSTSDFNTGGTGTAAQGTIYLDIQ